MKTCKNNHEYEDKHKACPECVRIRQKQYYLKNKEAILLSKKQDYQQNRVEIIEKVKEYERLNVEKIQQYKKTYRKEKREYLNKQNAQYKKQRRQNDSVFRMRLNLSCLINDAFRRFAYSKQSNTRQVIGCSFEYLYEHLVTTAFHNYGSYIDLPGIYHIDHIIPVSSATTIERLIELNHFSNLQLLYPDDNMKKGDHL